jgi:2-methylcitrate dehydratase PrpD
MQNIAEALATWSVGVKLADLPEPVVHEAKRCLVDTIGVMLAGTRHETARKTRELAVAEFAPGPCSLLGETSRISAPGAALANGVAAHVLDFDDVSHEAMVHGSVAVLPAALAAAELAGASGAELLEAFVAGAEAEYALGCAFTPDLFWRGWWTTGLLGAFGAAVAAARALGLDRQQTQNAICFAASQTSGTYTVVGTPLKPFANGRAAQLGVEAALYAHAGLTAHPDAFEHAKGFIAMFGDGTFERDLLDRLGTRFILVDPGLAYKLYPVCYGAQPATEALITLIAEEELDRSLITRVHCEVTGDTKIYLEYENPVTVTEAQFSMNFAVACVLVHGELGVAHLSEEVLRDPQIQAAMGNVEMTPNESLVEASDLGPAFPEAAIVTVTLADGRTFSKLNKGPTGSPVNPMPDEQMDRKFLDCVTPVLGGEAAEALLQRIRNLDEFATSASLFDGGDQGAATAAQ